MIFLQNFYLVTADSASGYSLILDCLPVTISLSFQTALCLQASKLDLQEVEKISINLHNKSIILFDWNYIKYEAENKNKLLSDKLIKENLDKFWLEYIQFIPKNHALLFLFKVEWAPAGGGYVTLDKLNILNNLSLPKTESGESEPAFSLQESYLELKDLLIKRLVFKDDFYKSTIINKIVVSFKLSPSSYVHRKSGLNLKDRLIKKQEKLFIKYSFPLNNNYSSWGLNLLKTNLISHEAANKFFLYQDNLKNCMYKISHLKNYTEIEVIVNGNTILIFKDYLIESTKSDRSLQSQILKRVIGNQEYYINLKTEELILKIEPKKVNIIKPIKKESKIITGKFITLDIETKLINNKHIPYLICFYDGVVNHSFYLADFKTHEELINAVIESLLKPK